MRLHALTVTGREHQREAVLSFLVEYFGEGPVPGEQLRFYGLSLRWAAGAVVGLEGRGDAAGTFVVQFSGETLDGLTPGRQRELVVGLYRLGVKCTRLDDAVDFVSQDGQPVGLIRELIAGCQDGELCGARVWEPVTRFRSCGELVAYGVKIGKRGKNGSGRFVRAYDKGLESGGAPAGCHERFEVEFTGDPAQKAFRLIAESPASEWDSVLWGLAFGSIEFREAVCGEGRHLARRPVCDWWKRWVSGHPCYRMVATRETRSLEGRAEWIVRAVLPGLRAMAAETRETVGAVLGHLERVVAVRRGSEWVREWGERATERAAASLVVRQFLERWRVQFGRLDVAGRVA